MPTEETDTEGSEKVNQGHLQAIAKLASNPFALIVYAIVAGGGAGQVLDQVFGPDEELEAHLHEEEKLPELRRHWTPDERRSLERRLEELERRLDEPEPVELDVETRKRVEALEVEVRTAVRLLELMNSSPTNGGASP